MTVYVDDWQQPARVGRLNAKWSHLRVGPFDDIAELHAFAEQIGLQRRWFQGPPRHAWPRSHYDVTEARRLEAIRAGAVPITWREAGQQLVRAREAQKAAQANVCTRTRDGKPLTDRDLWLMAKAVYEMKCAMAAAAGPAADGALF